jgi:hypothetical protein
MKARLAIGLLVFLFAATASAHPFGACLGETCWGSVTGGGGGTGDLTSITSTDGSVTITNGIGPIPNLAVSGVINADVTRLNADNGTTAPIDETGFCIEGGTDPLRPEADFCITYEETGDKWVIDKDRTLEALGYVTIQHLTTLGYVELTDPYIHTSQPTLTFYDKDAAAAYAAGALIQTNATVPTAGLESVDFTIQSKTAGALRTILRYVGSTGGLEIGGPGIPLESVSFWTNNAGNGEINLPLDSIGATEIDNTATLSSPDPNLGANNFANGTTGIIFEGSANDASEALLTVANPTADNTFTFPNASGEVSLLGQTIAPAEIAATGTPDATTYLRGDGAWAPSALPALASVPGDPPAGNAIAWFDTTVDQVKVVESDSTDHTLARRQNAVPSTNTILYWDGSQLSETSATWDPATGITAPGFVSSSTASPQPRSHQQMTTSCATTGSYHAAFKAFTDASSCVNFTAGGLDAVRNAAIPVNQSAGLNLRALTFTNYSFGASAGWEPDEKVELILHACTVLDVGASAELSDCTEVDRFVFQNATTPTAQYGGTLGTNRTALSCGVSGNCALTWPIDGLGKSGSNGTVTYAAGAVKYFILGFDSRNTNFTADEDGSGGGVDISGFSAAWRIDYEN